MMAPRELPTIAAVVLSGIAFVVPKLAQPTAVEMSPEAQAELV